MQEHRHFRHIRLPGWIHQRRLRPRPTDVQLHGFLRGRRHVSDHVIQKCVRLAADVRQRHTEDVMLLVAQFVERVPPVAAALLVHKHAECSPRRQPHLHNGVQPSCMQSTAWAAMHVVGDGLWRTAGLWRGHDNELVNSQLLCLCYVIVSPTLIDPILDVFSYFGGVSQVLTTLTVSSYCISPILRRSQFSRTAAGER